MKKLIKLFIYLLFLFPMTFVSSCEETSPTDIINEYKITIDPRNDGTLDMRFDISWTVLDDELYGPLSWVRIGIPNRCVSEIKPITFNIDDLKYSSDGGAFVEVYFDKEYYKNETINFSFSMHQSNLYTFDEEFCYFNYQPGWFEEIKVSKAIVLWNSKNVITSNANNYIGEYLIWEYSLDFGQTINVDLKYNKNAFEGLSQEGQYTDKYVDEDEVKSTIATIVVIVIIIAIFIILVLVLRDPYLNDRGFLGRRRSIIHTNNHRYFSSGYNRRGIRIVNPSNSSSHYGGRSGSSCACACACAGGGRAGCSRKDFCNKNIKIRKVIENIEKES